MLAEFVQAILGISDKSRRASVVTVPGVHRYAWLDVNDGNPEKIDLEPALVADEVLGIEDVVDVVRPSVDPAVWVSHKAVTVLPDRKDRRDRVTCPLRRGDIFKLLESMANPSHLFALSPAEAIRFLRFDLPGDHAQSLIDALREVDFQRKSDGRHVTEHGRESLGRAVEAKVQGQKDVPAEFAVTVAPFEIPGTRQMTVSVRVGIHLAPSDEKIVFRVLPGEIDRSLDAASVMIANNIRAQVGTACRCCAASQ